MGWRAGRRLRVRRRDRLGPKGGGVEGQTFCGGRGGGDVNEGGLWSHGLRVVLRAQFVREI